MKDQNDNKIFTVLELDWFRKNAYNIGLTRCTSASWGLNDIVCILAACLVFVDCYPSDIPEPEQHKIALMAMRCHFVIVAALVSLARTETKVDQKLQRYLELRQHAASFHLLMEFTYDQLADEVAKDLNDKLATLSVFNFEGAVALKAWDDLAEIVRRAELCKDEAALKAMGDCLLRSEAPGRGKCPFTSFSS